MTTIKNIHAREILDSRGFPTVEAEITLESGITAHACVPSGASTGSREALELRDKDPKRFQGKGVLKAVDNINHKIFPALKGKSVLKQKEIDDTLISLDGTEHKQNLGANATLAVSLACAVAAAKSETKPLYRYLSTLTGNELSLPVPMLNILNGGAHADNSVDVQEFMVIPCGADSFANALRFGVEIYHSLKAVLKKKGLNTNVGDEGGFAPDLPSNKAALDMIMQAIQDVGLTCGKDVFLGLDVAASELYKEGKYYLSSENKSLTSEQFVDELASWAKNYPIISIEDGMDENDWQGWALLTQKLGDKVQLVGDDLFVTNTKIFKEGISAKVANAILIKLNQIGTLSETIEAINLAKSSNYNTIVSHRSGETEDTFIADLAVGLNVGQIKTGAPARSDRTAKYNQLLRIAEHSKADFSGLNVFRRWEIK
ncbi:MAG: phosphopyruvate hydratase [Gammaproteobacteria bacterium 39-13]|nr:phosphopyruvate hydratase [Gammaproteobacteria bacterium]OJV85241.1 MAG: phosphopyruvate hydratase [Gammaproteobacteria bacterium 39-13]